MKGWPLLRSFLALVALLLAGLPLRSLTREKTTQLPAKPNIRVTFTQPPQTFSVKFLGKEILAGKDSTTFDASTTIEARFPDEGIDLVFEGTWPEYFRKVGASIRVTRENSQQTQTLWGKRNIFELLTFTGKEQP